MLLYWPNNQWNVREDYLYEAYKFAAENSTDPDTQNGAILVDGTGTPVAWGANRFPKGIQETPQRLVRPIKYNFIGHAEDFAVMDAARRGVSTVGLTMYATWASCNECANSIIESGVCKVVTHTKTQGRTPIRWAESIRMAFAKFNEAHVAIEIYEGDIGGIEIRFNGETFRP